MLLPVYFTTELSVGLRLPWCGGAAAGPFEGEVARPAGLGHDAGCLAQALQGPGSPLAAALTSLANA